MNPLEKIVIGKEYISGPLASADLHAGGIFFCTPYYECLTFIDNKTVEIKRRVIENFRPMDGLNEINAYNAFRIVGTYSLNGRGYIHCIFEDIELTGLPLEERSELIAFYRFHRHSGMASGVIFQFSKESHRID